MCRLKEQGTKGKSLEDFHVEWSHTNMKKQTPTTALDTHLFKQMCVDAGAGVEMQCAREYWCESDNPRATQLFKVSEEELENLPTENLEPERYMAKVGCLAAQSAAHSNKLFKAKRMRDDLLFMKESTTETKLSGFSASQRKIFKELDNMETSWSAKQRQSYKGKLAALFTKNENRRQFVDILLQKCKEHNGPVTNEKELVNLVESAKDEKSLKSSTKRNPVPKSYSHQRCPKETRSL